MIGKREDNFFKLGRHLQTSGITCICKQNNSLFSSLLVGDMEKGCLTSMHFSQLVVLGLRALRDSISVCIGPSPREREKEKRNDRR